MDSNSTPRSGGAFKGTLLFITVAAMLVSLVSIVAILVEYFSQIAVWPPLMAVGLWGLPLAFIGLVALVLVNVAERRRTDRAASRS